MQVPFCGDGSEAVSYLDSATQSIKIDCSEVSLLCMSCWTKQLNIVYTQLIHLYTCVKIIMWKWAVTRNCFERIIFFYAYLQYNIILKSNIRMIFIAKYVNAVFFFWGSQYDLFIIYNWVSSSRKDKLFILLTPSEKNNSNNIFAIKIICMFDLKIICLPWAARWLPSGVPGVLCHDAVLPVHVAHHDRRQEQPWRAGRHPERVSYQVLMLTLVVDFFLQAMNF